MDIDQRLEFLLKSTKALHASLQAKARLKEKVNMDYEQKIRQLEEETRHWRAMQELHKGSLDAHARSITSLDNRLDRVETNLEIVSSQLTTLVRAQAETDRMLRDLIQALLPHSNGKG